MNLFEFVKSIFSKKEGRNLYRPPLSNRDLALFVVVFTSVFGILSAMPKKSLLGLFIGIVHIIFWTGMAFSGGRRLAKGFYIPASIIWGSTLLLTVLNYILGDTSVPSYGAFVDTLYVGLIMFLQLVAMAILNPLFPIFFYLDYYPGNSANPRLELLTISLVSFAVICLAFLLGHFYGKLRPLGSKGTRNPYLPPDAKE